MAPKDKEKQEFTELIGRHERLVHKVCNLYATDTEDYKDLFQEIILQFWTAYPKFRNAAKVSTWLYRIALNTAISCKRNRNKKVVPFPLDAVLLQVADTHIADHEEYQLMWQLISRLPQLEKALILLYLEDNSYEDIAAIMGLTVTNVGTRLGRIRDKLKKQAQKVLQ